MKRNQFHVFYALQQFQERWILLLLPLINALVRFDLAGLITSLIAEAAVILILGAVSLLIWQNAWWHLGEGGLTVSTGLWWHRVITLRPEDLACVEVYRRPLQRMAGAAQVNLYYAHQKGKVMLYLPWRDARPLAEALMKGPAPGSRVYRPKGLDRVGLAAVSSNLFAGIWLVIFTWRQTAQVLDQLAFVDRESLEQAAFSRIETLEQYAALFLPAGLAWLVTAAMLFWVWALMGSALRTARFSVAGDGHQLRTRSGILTKVTRTVDLSCLTAVDMRQGPAARITRCYPIYLKAGSFGGGDVPCCLYRVGREHYLQDLIPDCPLWTKLGVVPLKKRSIPAFLAFPGVCGGTALVLYLVSRWALPQVSWILGVLVLLCLFWAFFQLEGFFREGVTCLGEDRILVRYVKGYTHHRVMVVTPYAGYWFYQTPYNMPYGRGTLRIRLPAGQHLRVRSILKEGLRRELGKENIQ